jgi:hypothetical protein
MLDSDSDHYRIFLFNALGLNKIEGIYATVDKLDTAKNQANQVINGLYFVGYRHRSKTEVQNLVSTKSFQPSQNTAPRGQPADSQVIEAIVSQILNYN